MPKPEHTLTADPNFRFPGVYSLYLGDKLVGEAKEIAPGGIVWHCLALHYDEWVPDIFVALERCASHHARRHVATTA